MDIRAYNNRLGKYEIHTLPEAAGVTYIPDMYIECAQCGVCITGKKYGPSYELRDNNNKGYLVCESCYNDEETIPF